MIHEVTTNKVTNTPKEQRKSRNGIRFESNPFFFNKLDKTQHYRVKTTQLSPEGWLGILVQLNELESNILGSFAYLHSKMKLNTAVSRSKDSTHMMNVLRSDDFLGKKIVTF